MTNSNKAPAPPAFTEDMFRAYVACLAPCASPAAFMAMADAERAWLKSLEPTGGISRRDYEAVYTSMAARWVREGGVR